MPTISERCSANAANACPKGAALVRCPSPAIEAIIADVVRRGFLTMASVIFFSIALCSIQNGDGLLPFGLIDPDEMIFLALLQERNAFAHQGIEQDHAGLVAPIRSSRIECRKHGSQVIAVHPLHMPSECLPLVGQRFKTQHMVGI